MKTCATGSADLWTKPPAESLEGIGYAEAIDRMLQEEMYKPPYDVELTDSEKEAMLQRLKNAYPPDEIRRFKNNLPYYRIKTVSH